MIPPSHKWKFGQGIRKHGAQLLSGFAVGLLNGLLGAGGGMLAVPLLKKAGLRQTHAHATSISIILPLSLVSACLYLALGSVKLAAAWPFMPAGIAGALVGAWLLPKIPTHWLRRIFGVFLLWAGVRLLLR